MAEKDFFVIGEVGPFGGKPIRIPVRPGTLTIIADANGTIISATDRRNEIAPEPSLTLLDLLRDKNKNG